MRKVVLYIAQSLDGKIAKPDGDVAWLEALPPCEEDADYGYNLFLNTIDTVIMGNTTYQQVIDFDIEYPYKNFKTLVCTRKANVSSRAGVEFIHSDIPEFIANLKKTKGKDIWLIGGAQINTLFLQNNLIDEIILFTMPITIGQGIPLFSDNRNTSNLTLNSCISYSNGVVKSIYSL